MDRLSLLPALLSAYGELLSALSIHGVDWVQIDEPILGLDLPADWLAPASRPIRNWPRKPAPAAGSYFAMAVAAARLAQTLCRWPACIWTWCAPEQLAGFVADWPA